MIYYNINYEKLVALRSKAALICTNLRYCLQNTYQAVKDLINENTFEGASAAAAKHYFKEVHLTALTALDDMINLFERSLLLYHTDLQSNVDANEYTEISQQQLQEMQKYFEDCTKTFEGIVFRSSQIVSSISDLISVAVPQDARVNGAQSANLLHIIETQRVCEATDGAHLKDCEPIYELVNKMKAFMTVANKMNISSYQPNDYIQSVQGINFCNALYDVQAKNKEIETRALGAAEAEDMNPVYDMVKKWLPSINITTPGGLGSTILITGLLFKPINPNYTGPKSNNCVAGGIMNIVRDNREITYSCLNKRYITADEKYREKNYTHETSVTVFDSKEKDSASAKSVAKDILSSCSKAWDKEMRSARELYRDETKTDSSLYKSNETYNVYDKDIKTDTYLGRHKREESLSAGYYYGEYNYNESYTLAEHNIKDGNVEINMYAGRAESKATLAVDPMRGNAYISAGEGIYAGGSEVTYQVSESTAVSVEVKAGMGADVVGGIKNGELKLKGSITIGVGVEVELNVDMKKAYKEYKKSQEYQPAFFPWNEKHYSYVPFYE